MPAFAAYAPGKIILFGEHAVVYGRPAIAVPVTQVKARVSIQAESLSSRGAIRLISPAIKLDSMLDVLPADHALVQSLAIFREHFGITSLPACTVRINSDIPVASGMGSGAAVSIALFRALSAFIGHPMSNEVVSRLAFEMEKVYHGTPSGIDNTIIAFSRPVYFIKGEVPELLAVGKPFKLLVADTGIPSPTASTVREVRENWQQQPSHYENIFDQIGAIVNEAKQNIANGTPEKLGTLMDQNHQQLQMLGVSCPELDNLVQRARNAGVLGAKLSGGGRGGNMIALVDENNVDRIENSIRQQASRIIITEVKSDG